MDQPKDYLAALIESEGDLKQYGVPGMKWGQRKSKSSSSPPAQLSVKPDGPETSSARHARLTADIKAGKASELSDDDLRFYAARSEAVARVERITAENPNWLAEASKATLRTTTKKLMKSVSVALADKYIGKPITSAIAGSKPKKD